MEEKELYKRVKIYRASREAVLDTVQRMCQYRNVVQHQELPEGYIVLGVYYNNQCASFDYTVAHESFPIVADGCMIPMCENDYGFITETYEVKPVGNYPPGSDE